MKKKAVLFDLDDTLLWDERSVQEAFDLTCREASEAAGVDPKALEQAVRKEARALYEAYETFPFTQMIGINPFEGLWGNFREGAAPEFRALERIAPQYRADAWTRGLLAVGVNDKALGAALGERFPAIRRSLAYVYEETYDVLDALKGKVKLLLLTNGSPDLQKEKLAGVPKLAPYFDHIVISGDYGRGKPDPGIFRHAVDLLGIEPAEGVMIGDKLTTDILGSSRIGMDNVWINHHGAEVGSHVPPKHTVTRLKHVLEVI
ncbi:HAD family hydrolase [Paenibacillus sp.]|uniref:HAD family hydrolase n=1 Tax=Paenibacillus sp. TaxID=58172 RepID=UPI002D72EFF7|nr:HAD family hydrolase [Paenibacillus sp.]HZG56061.1 HAD family hydrolase [Paenibacillus sp.]